jgi:hypothetical protein
MEKTDFDPIADAPRRAEVAVLFKRAILTEQSEPGQKPQQAENLRADADEPRAVARAIQRHARHYVDRDLANLLSYARGLEKRALEAAKADRAAAVPTLQGRTPRQTATIASSRQ